MWWEFAGVDHNSNAAFRITIEGEVLFFVG